MNKERASTSCKNMNTARLEMDIGYDFGLKFSHFQWFAMLIIRKKSGNYENEIIFFA
jgi:hypothetical protein